MEPIELHSPNALESKGFVLLAVFACVQPERGGREVMVVVVSNCAIVCPCLFISLSSLHLSISPLLPQSVRPSLGSGQRAAR